MAEHTNFLTAEDGALTVDWVVLTAALVGLGLASAAVVSIGVQNASEDLEGTLKHDNLIHTSFSHLSDGTFLSDSQESSLKQHAFAQMNSGLSIEYSNALSQIDANFASWLAGVNDGTYTLDGGGTNYVDGNGDFAFTKADYDNSGIYTETAAIYEDEANQRGLSWNAGNSQFE